MFLQEGLSLAKFVKSSPALLRMVKPMANAYARAAGYRQMGLKYDDLVQEEKPEVQKVCIYGMATLFFLFPSKSEELMIDIVCYLPFFFFIL